MHMNRNVGRLALVVFAVVAMFGTTSLFAKEYTILLKDAGGNSILGAGTFDWEPNETTVDFPAQLTILNTTFSFSFVGATVDFEADHASCIDPDAAPEAKVCPSRVRAVIGSAPATGFPDVELILSDNANRDDRIGIWNFGNVAGSTFITSDAASIPAPAPALLFLAGLPVLALVRRRLQRRSHRIQ